MEAEYDRLSQHVKTDKLGWIIDCLRTLAVKGSNTTEESKLSRLTELAVFSMRGFGTSPNRQGEGLYGPELESTLKRQSLSSEPTKLASGIRAPIRNRVVKGASPITWGRPMAKYAEDTCLLGDFFSRGEDNYLDYRPMDSKAEVRPTEPVTANMLGKCATAQSRYFAAAYGGDIVNQSIYPT